MKEEDKSELVFCKDCEHITVNERFGSQLLCSRDAIKRYNLVTGKAFVVGLMSCEDERASNCEHGGKCGMKGKFYLRKTKNK